MFNRILKVYLLAGWYPLFAILIDKRWPRAEDYIVPIIIHITIVIALNFIVNQKLTIWYKESEK